MAPERPSYRLELQYPHKRGHSSIWSEYGTYRTFERAMDKVALQARPCRIVEYRVVWRSVRSAWAAAEPRKIAAPLGRYRGSRGAANPRRNVMADRVSASITVGGTLPAALLPDLLAAIECEGLSTEWDGEPFVPDQLPDNGPLILMAHEVAWGRFEELEVFCVENGLPFARWSGAYAGQWGAERTVFTGNGEPQGYAADEDDYILIGRCTVERLGSMEAILAHLDAADFAIPPLVLAEEPKAKNG